MNPIEKLQRELAEREALLEDIRQALGAELRKQKAPTEDVATLAAVREVVRAKGEAGARAAMKGQALANALRQLRDLATQLDAWADRAGPLRESLRWRADETRKLADQYETQGALR